MKCWLRRGGAAALLAGALTGCANVKVEKVDLQQRIAGQDQCVKGFRYYLTRPYLVVGSRVCISTTYIPASVAVYPKDAKADMVQPLAPGTELVLVAQVPDAEGQYRVYDRAGKPRPDLQPGQVRVLTVSAQPNVNNKPGTPLDLPTLVDQVAGQTAAEVKKLNIDPTQIMPAQKWNDYLPPGNAVKTALNAQQEAAALNMLLQPGGDQAEVNAIHEAAGVAIKTVNDFLGDATHNPSGKKLTIAQDALEKEIKTALDAQASRSPMTPMTPMTPKTPMTGAAQAALSTTQNAAPAPAPAGNGNGNGNGTGTTPPEAFQVIFLPDFEEQYAINNVNVLAKTQYKYTFRNGTDLETMAGAYDGTDVPVEILGTVGALVKAFGAVAQTRLNPSSGGGAAALALQTNTTQAAYYVRIDQAIEPGVYRVQKSWERVAATPLDGVKPEQACGLFADVGLQIVETTSVITSDQYTALNPPPAPAPAPSK